ncbi:MAG: hypothetical protein M1281_02845 [Chloroflexi bacterium]|nr:hypothetical protein [Chloroflexota bacterium]
MNTWMFTLRFVGKGSTQEEAFEDALDALGIDNLRLNQVVAEMIENEDSDESTNSE